MRVHIIGGGIIGLSAAAYLRERGAEVAVLEAGDFHDGCSFGNAGLVVPSHFVPLAAPGVVAKGLRWMFNPSSPFFIHPRWDPNLLHWLWRFWRACRPEVAECAMPLLRDFNLLSLECYREWVRSGLECAFEEKGMLMLCRSACAEREELEAAEKANALGVEARPLSPEKAAELEPGTPMNIRRAVYYPGDTHLHPGRLMERLRERVKEQGVQLMPGAEVHGFRTQGSRVRALVLQDGRELSVEEVVCAAGAWSGRLLRSLGVKVLMEAGKGYSVTLEGFFPRPSIPSILSEEKVAVTPMGDALRLGGTLEISPFDRRVHRQRLRAILQAFERYYPTLKLPDGLEERVWVGFRPCTPDGLPYIGRVGEWKNLTLAAGHAMMGISLGPATGLLVAQLLCGEKTSLPMEPFRIGR